MVVRQGTFYTGGNSKHTRNENTLSQTYMFHVASLKPAQDPWQLIHSCEGCAFNPHGLKHWWKGGKKQEISYMNHLWILIPCLVLMSLSIQCWRNHSNPNQKGAYRHREWVWESKPTKNNGRAWHVYSRPTGSDRTVFKYSYDDWVRQFCIQSLGSDHCL